jgi:hypothetical protein
MADEEEQELGSTAAASGRGGREVPLAPPLAREVGHCVGR